MIPFLSIGERYKIRIVPQEMVYRQEMKELMEEKGGTNLNRGKDRKHMKENLKENSWYTFWKDLADCLLALSISLFCFSSGFYV